MVFFGKRRAALEIVFHGAPCSKNTAAMLGSAALTFGVYLTATAPPLCSRLIQSRYVA